MRYIHGMAVWGVVTMLLVGCGKKAANGPSAGKSPTHNSTPGKKADPNALSGPAAAVHGFLEAVRTGNDDQAARMLSKLAREKMTSLNRNVTPPASDTARFSIGKVEYVGEDGARVESSWTDVDENGKQRTDRPLWVVRREKDGWKVAGVAVVVFPGEPPLLLNFENPEEMFRKQQWVREEIQRRMNAEPSEEQANAEKNRENTIRR